MESNIKYVAKDGREFSDPERLERYEKALATDRNTIGFLVNLLSSLDGYVTGVIICLHKGVTHSQPFVTVCIDDWLKDFVDVETLTQEQRYLDSSTGRCAAVLRRKFDPEDQCEYLIIIGKTVEMDDSEYLSNFNPKMKEMLMKKKRKN
jgi:hypothetical protein